MSREVVLPAGSPPPLAPYSPGIKADNVLYVSGTLPMDSNGDTVAVGDVRAQTRNVLESIRSVVEAAGSRMDQIAYNMIFLKSLDDYAAMNEVYGQYFSGQPPARFCIQAELVRPDFLVEITSIVHLSKDS